MTKHTFTAPQDGTYHVVTGQPAHLLYTECTAECGTFAGDGSPHPVSVEFDTYTPDPVEPSDEFLADLASPIRLEPRATPIRDGGRHDD